MTISWADWEKYISDLRKINDTGAELVRNYLKKHGLPQTQAETDALIDYAWRVCFKYGEASATLASEMYDTLAEMSSVALEAAAPASVPEISEVAKAVVGTANIGNEEIVTDAVWRLIKMVGVDTLMQNALRDGAEWAWIPHGETCAFCLTLASRGWQKASKKAIRNGHAAHIHPNCDCTYAVRFDSDTNVEGYDPDALLKKYNDAPGTKWKDKVNAIRREQYQKNKDEINEQKRINYAERKEREQ